MRLKIIFVIKYVKHDANRNWYWKKWFYPKIKSYLKLFGVAFIFLTKIDLMQTTMSISLLVFLVLCISFPVFYFCTYNYHYVSNHSRLEKTKWVRLEKAPLFCKGNIQIRIFSNFRAKKPPWHSVHLSLILHISSQLSFLSYKIH